MIYQLFHPTFQLNAFIKYYWYMEDHLGNPHQKDLLIPDLSSELIFNYDSLYHRFSVHEHKRENISESSITGQRSKSILANRPFKTQLFGVKFKPGALSVFFGVPEKELKNQSISLCELGDKSLMELEDKVLHTKNIHLIPQLLDQYFTYKVKSSEITKLNIFNQYLDKIMLLKDVSGLESFRTENKLHYKKLERLFAQFGGISARNFIRINRFKKFYKAYNKGKQSFYNSSIYEFGYYDQNHFIKDFFHFTNQNPSQYYKLDSPLTDSILIQTLNYLEKRR